MWEVVLQIAMETLCGATGHFVLWCLSLGRWDVANGRDVVAAIVGILTWLAVGILIWLLVIR